MKIIYKIKIHIFFYFAFILAILTGNFKIYIALTIITIFHELGHIIISYLFKWEIDYIKVMPLSLVTIFKTSINKPIYEEFLVTIFGPLFQILIAVLIKDNNILLLNKYLLLFNLLPLYPLDGYKLLTILLSLNIPYKKVLKYIPYLSIIILNVLLYITKFNLLIILIYIAFILAILRHTKKINYIYNKFILERYLHDYKYPRISLKRRPNINLLYKYKKTDFIYENKIYFEEKIISKTFDNKGNI